ncbi:MAG: hypothetical protein GY707_01895 [Desulfobacteraceae bacterium]|nr:hypothetical protein [Desulfobacteraceae bacterium]
MSSKYIHYAAVIACTLMIGCVTPLKDKPDVKGVESVNQSKFSAPEKVTIHDLPVWHGRTTMSVEEPFVSRDGQFLFFNSNERENNRDLHFAKLINGQWVYKGEIGPGISGNGKELYYHKQEGKKFGLYKVRILEPLQVKHGNAS